jgi:putative FmdB family regulatory protein
MPIFEYRCPKCELVFEELVSGENRDPPLPVLIADPKKLRN